MLVLTAAEARELDRATIEEVGVPGVVLMEHAARAVADAALALLAPGGRAAVVCGAGNNGGDGYAAARLLHVAGRDVRVVALVEPSALRGDAATNAAIWARLGPVERISPHALADLRGGDVVVDAIFGTGLSREAAGAFAEAIRATNEARARGCAVVAVDLPSGVSADTGAVLGSAVRASVTVTCGASKRGLVLQPGAAHAGEVRVADLSIPPALLGAIAPAVRTIEEAEARALLPARAPDSHKGTFGHALVVAGSFGKSGAAALAGRAALVAGAGLVTVATRPAIVDRVLGHAMELMGAALPAGEALGLADAEALADLAGGKDAALLGPGIPRGAETGALLGRLLGELECPVVLDADALNALEGRPEALDGAATEVVLTPHPGEMARLAGLTVAEVQADRIELARLFAREHLCTVVLKGHGTVIAAPDGEVAIGTSGNAGLATAGTGDVLGGLIAGLLAQGLRAWDAARLAVHVHGLAAERMTPERGMAGLVAGDLLEGVGRVWASWNR